MYVAGSGSAGGARDPVPVHVTTELLFLHTRTTRLERPSNEAMSFVTSVVTWTAVAGVGVAMAALPRAQYCAPVRAAFAIVIQANKKLPKFTALTIKRK